MVFKILILLPAFFIGIMNEATSTEIEKEQVVKERISSKGNLLGCYDKPNCISTSDDREDFNMKTRKLSKEASIEKIKALLMDEFGAAVVKESDSYLHVTVKTLILRFTDDLEFLLKDGFLQFRSESRVGYSDLGKNRSRMNEILELLESKGLIVK